MALTFNRVHPHFVAEVSAGYLRSVHDRETLNEMRTGMDEYAILVFHDQSFQNEGRLLILELIEHASQSQFEYRHAWSEGDLVIWDNRATMHRGRPYYDTRYRRELVGATTLDIERPAA